MPLNSPSDRPGERAFVIPFLAAKPRPENAFVYDKIASEGLYVESDRIGLRGGINTYSYANSAVLSRVDPYGLKALSYDQIAEAVSRNNHSGVADALIICLLWNESSFDPNAGGGRIGTGNGLGGVTRIATQQVNNILGGSVYSYKSWADPSWNIDVSTRYLNWVLTKLTDGDVATALQRYGTGETYPAGKIQDCANCLQKQGDSSQCLRDPQSCLNKVHK